MAKKKDIFKGKMMRRLVRSVLVAMFVLIVVLGTVSFIVLKKALLYYTNVVAYTAANSLTDSTFKAINEYSATGTIDQETLGDTYAELYELQIDWELIDCFVAVPQEDGLRYLFGVGDSIIQMFLEYDLEALMEHVEPYPKGLGMQAWLQSLLEAEDASDVGLLTYKLSHAGHVAYAAKPIYDIDDELVAFGFVRVSLEGVYRLTQQIWIILIGLIALFTIIVIFIYNRHIQKCLVKPIQQLNSGALAITKHLREGEVYHSDIHTGDEIEELSESFELMSRELWDYISENTRITAEKERISTELDMAANIQASQLPSTFPAFPERLEFDLYAYMKPAKEVGGDFYDFFLVDDDHLALVMADVSGKGVPAALFMMTAKTLIKTQLKAGLSPAQTLQSVNEQLLETNRTKQFVTVWLGVVELSTGKVVESNAGHEHPALCRAGEGYALVVYKHSPPVAATKLSRFRDREFELLPGDSLFVYTDGVAEATDAEEALFGTDRMLEALNRAPDADPEAAIRNVRGAIREFVGDADQFDDITMLCLRYNGPGGLQE